VTRARVPHCSRDGRIERMAYAKGERQPSEKHLAMVRCQGRHAANIAKKLEG
jgi:hypothetical protein